MSLIQPDNQPMPRAQDIFDSLHGRVIFSKLDFQSAYLQIPDAEECRHFLSFVTRSGQYEFCNVPFGLNIAGNKLQRELNSLFCRPQRPQEQTRSHVPCRKVSDSWLQTHVTSRKQPGTSSKTIRKFKKAIQLDQVRFFAVSRQEVNLWHSMPQDDIIASFELLNTDKTAINLSTNTKGSIGIKPVKLLIKGLPIHERISEMSRHPIALHSHVIHKCFRSAVDELSWIHVDAKTAVFAQDS
jgi:hypothetical protein